MTLSATDKAALEDKLRSFVGVQAGPADVGLDEVNEPMIRHWCEVMGDGNPVYTDREAAASSVHGGIVAPPTMLQAWILRGLEMATPADGSRDDKQLELHELLSENGYTGVVATNCDQGYTRYLRPGDRVSATTTIESVSDEKATGLGSGYFIVTRTEFSDQAGDSVAWMSFRVLKFRPNQPPPAVTKDDAPAAKPRRLRPALGHDNRWWWDGLERDELLIQKCSSCGVLRHPPRPMCGKCQSVEWGSILSKGDGTIASYVVMHQPQVPGYEYPLVVAVIDLDEGTRFVSNIVGTKPEDVAIGQRVKLKIENVDEEMKLPLFELA